MMFEGCFKCVWRGVDHFLAPVSRCSSPGRLGYFPVTLLFSVLPQTQQVSHQLTVSYWSNLRRELCETCFNCTLYPVGQYSFWSCSFQVQKSQSSYFILSISLQILHSGLVGMSHIAAIWSSSTWRLLSSNLWVWVCFNKPEWNTLVISRTL